MSGELRIPNVTGLAVYAHVTNSTSRRWNGSQFEVYSASDYSLYTVTTTEQGGSGVYVGNFPIGITTSGHYEIIYYVRNGASPTEGDTAIGTSSLDWTGEAIEETTPTIVDAMSGDDWLTYVVRAFKRTDKEDEIFDATKDIIDDMRLKIIFPEDETDGDVTDTIDTLGDYRLSLEGDLGHFLSNIVLVDGDFGFTLNKVSKAEYDRLYTGFGTSSSAQARPRDYCLFGDNILLGPVPDSIDYVYKISYASDDLASYDSDSASIPFTNKYRRILRWGVLAFLFSDIVKNDDQAAKFGTLYETGLKKIENRIDRNRVSIVRTRYRGI